MMTWAEISKGFVTAVTLSETEEFGGAWLSANVGGVWVECPDSVYPGVVYDFDLNVFVNNGWRARIVAQLHTQAADENVDGAQRYIVTPVGHARGKPFAVQHLTRCADKHS